MKSKINIIYKEFGRELSSAGEIWIFDVTDREQYWKGSWMEIVEYISTDLLLRFQPRTYNS